MTRNRPMLGVMRQLKRSCLGNPAGTWGVCFNIEPLGDRHTYQFIFPNGDFDGFSPQELKDFFNEDQRYSRFVANYMFTNVMQLSRDFEDGKFKSTFDYV